MYPLGACVKRTGGDGGESERGGGVDGSIEEKKKKEKFPFLLLFFPSRRRCGTVRFQRRYKSLAVGVAGRSHPVEAPRQFFFFGGWVVKGSESNSTDVIIFGQKDFWKQFKKKEKRHSFSIHHSGRLDVTCHHRLRASWSS